MITTARGVVGLGTMRIPCPWGRVVHHIRHAPGLHELRTAGGGGGYLIAKKLALSRLSDAARNRAQRYGYYYGFPFVHDPTSAIIPYELEDLRDQLLSGGSHHLDVPPDQYLWRALSCDAPDYLRERGIEPDADLAAKWDRRQQARAAVERRDPDTIEASRGEWHTGAAGVSEVATADSRVHRVTTRSLLAQPPEWRKLSLCQPASDAAGKEINALAVPPLISAPSPVWPRSSSN